MATLFSIGYAGFSIERFIDALKEYEIAALVDVRAMPWISHFEVYKRDKIRKTLTDNDIIYKFFGRLLGARPENQDYYSNGKVDFQKIAASPDFTASLRNIKSGMEKHGNICLMCAQIDPLICHRSILITHNMRKLYPDLPICHIRPGFEESQEELDRRIVKLYRKEKYKSSLLASLRIKNDSELDEAYAWQADKIAWRPD